jgi:hypothetical protein
MTDEQSTSETTWEEIGEQFRTLGESIAEALRVTWEREETRHHVQELQTGLEGLVNNVGRAINEFGESTEGQRLRGEAKKAAESARVAGEKAWQDAQPHILAALQQVNAELRKVTGRVSQAQAESESAPPETE